MSRYIVLVGILLFSFQCLMGEVRIDNDSIKNVCLDEITVYKPYSFANSKEEKKFQELEKDIRAVYPLVQIVQKEYSRVNKEMLLYNEEERKKYLKWYESYAREHYIHYLSDLSIRQGKLFLKLIDRELNTSPYELIKTYRNGFRAIFWQGTAFLFTANLKTNYDATENPMIEYIIREIETENSIGQGSPVQPR
jgi:hypothetical protein